MNRQHQTVLNSEVTFPADVELISTTDTRGVIQYANAAFCQVSGYSNEELIGKKSQHCATSGHAQSRFCRLMAKYTTKKILARHGKKPL